MLRLLPSFSLYTVPLVILSSQPLAANSALFVFLIITIIISPWPLCDYFKQSSCSFIIIPTNLTLKPSFSLFSISFCCYFLQCAILFFLLQEFSTHFIQHDGEWWADWDYWREQEEPLDRNWAYWKMWRDTRGSWIQERVNARVYPFGFDEEL